MSLIIQNSEENVNDRMLYFTQDWPLPQKQRQKCDTICESVGVIFSGLLPVMDQSLTISERIRILKGSHCPEYRMAKTDERISSHKRELDMQGQELESHAIAIEELYMLVLAQQKELESLKKEVVALKTDKTSSVVCSNAVPKDIVAKYLPNLPIQQAPKPQKPRKKICWDSDREKKIFNFLNSKTANTSNWPPTTFQGISAYFSYLLWEVAYRDSLYKVESTRRILDLDPHGTGFWSRLAYALSSSRAWPVNDETAQLIDFFLSTDFTAPNWEKKTASFVKAFESSREVRAETLVFLLKELSQKDRILSIAIDNFYQPYRGGRRGLPRLPSTPLFEMGLEKVYGRFHEYAGKLLSTIEDRAVKESFALMISQIYLKTAQRLLKDHEFQAFRDTFALAEKALEPIQYLLLPEEQQPAAMQNQRLMAPFVQGQPLQLTNDGTSCFINAPFWMLMNDPVVAEAVVDSCRRWDASFTALEKLVAWLKKKDENPKPSQQDIAFLMPMFAREEIGATWYANTIGRRIDTEALRAFDTQMKAFIRSRQDNVADPVLQEQDFVLLDAALDAFREDDFQGIFQAQAKRAEAIRFFPGAVERYRNAGQNQMAQSGLVLTPLRKLMPDGMGAGQNDAEEWLRKVYEIIDRRKFPQCFFSEAVVRHFIAYDPAEEAPLKAQEQLERLALYARENRPVDLMAETGDIVCKRELSYNLFALPPEGQGAEAAGQDLIDKLFASARFADNEPAIYKDPATDKLALYKIDSDKLVIDQLPDRMLFTLKRFQENRAKNNNIVHMPQTVKVSGVDYDVTAIMIHQGTVEKGHYTALIRQGAVWWLCDDQMAGIRPATEEELNFGLTRGYGYSLRRR